MRIAASRSAQSLSTACIVACHYRLPRRVAGEAPRALAPRSPHMNAPPTIYTFGVGTLGAGDDDEGMHSDEYDTDASTDASDSGGDDDDEEDVIDGDVSGDAAPAGAGSSGNGVRQPRSDRGSTSVTVGRCRLTPVSTS